MDHVTRQRIASACRQFVLKSSVSLAVIFNVITPVVAHAALPQGTLGWVYGFSDASVKDTPDEACKAFFPLPPLRYAGIGPLITNGRWDPTRYWCKGKVSPTDIPGNYLTYLLCERGYVARYPGVCIKGTKPAPPPPPASCSASGVGFVQGDPVIVSSGSKFEREVDFVAGSAGSLDISRSYRSVFEEPRDQELQAPWAFSFERTLVPEISPTGGPPMRVRVYDADSSEIEFAWTAKGYVTSNVDGATLRQLTAAGDDWEYTSPDGRLDYFKKLPLAKRFLLSGSYSKEGMPTVFEYSLQSGALVLDMSDGFGRTVNIRWGDLGVAEINGKGIRAVYQYEAVDYEFMHGARLSAVRLLDPSGELVASKQYHYEQSAQTYFNWFLLTGVTDENGARFASDTYDDAGRVLIAEQAGNAGRHAFSYQEASERTVIDSLGTERKMVIAHIGGKLLVQSINQPGGAGCSPAASAFAYDSAGRLSSRTDFNNHRACFFYDAARGLETVRREGISGASPCSSADFGSGPNERKISTHWHPDWRIEEKVAAPLKITSSIYNGQPDVDGRILTCATGGTLPNGKPIAVLCKRIEQGTADADGRLGFKAAPVGTARVTTFTYNRLGQILSSSIIGRQPGMADTTAYLYFTDAAATHARGDLWKIVNPKGQVKEFAEYTSAGLPARVVAPNGLATLLSYDLQQRLTRQAAFAGTAAEQITEYVYDRAGQLTTTRAADGSTVTYAYDAAHRLTDISDASGSSIHYELDGAGNRIKTEVRSPSGMVTRRTVQSFDALGRLQATSAGIAQ